MKTSKVRRVISINMPLEERSRNDFLEGLRRILIIAATIATTTTGAWAQGAPSSSLPSSSRGPNFPSLHHGSAYPATLPDQRPGPAPSAAGPPAPQSRDILSGGPTHGPSIRNAINGWNTLALGPGEQITSVDIQCDQGLSQCNNSGTTTKVIRTDTWGAWLHNNNVPYCGNSYVGQPKTGCWANLVTPATMPNGAGQANPADFSGVVEIQAAPSNTSHLYMIWSADGCLYSSTNRGTSWTKLTQPSGSCLDLGSAGAVNGYNSNTGASGSKFYHPFLAIDPHNENVVVVSTPGNHGSYYTTVGGVGAGAWTAISAIGNGTTTPDGSGGGAVFAFDSTSWSSGSTPGIYACVYGNGVWHTSMGVSGTWTKQNGSSGTMPTKCREIKVDGAGVLWAIDDNNSIFGGGSSPYENVNTYTLSTTTWSRLTSLSTIQATFVGLAVDYDNCSTTSGESSCHICISDQGGGLFCSTTGNSRSGGGFGTRSPASGARIDTIANDVPWLGPTFTGRAVNLSVGNVEFDPAQSNVVGVTTGFGYLEAAVGSLPTTNLAYTSLNAGIAQFNAIQALMLNGAPIVSVYDHSVVVMSAPGVHPSSVGNGINGNIIAGWGISSPPGSTSFATLLATGSGNSSGSYNSGAWTAWPNTPTEIQTPGTGNITAPGGSIAASTITNWVAYPGSNGDLYYTINGASSAWNLVCPGNGTGVACGGLVQTSTTRADTTLSFSSVPTQVQIGFNTNKYSYVAIDATACPNFYPPPTITAVTSTSIRISTAMCGGSGTTANDYIWIRPAMGWTNASYYHDHRVCADAAGNGTFYALYDGQGTPGIWATTNGGSSWNLAYNRQFSGGSNATGAFLQCVPGNTFDMYGGEDGGGAVQNHSFYECASNGGTPPTITCTPIVQSSTSPIGSVTYGATVTDVSCLGFGKNKSGTYPSIYFVGKVGGTLSIWQTNDHFRTFTNLQTLSGVTAISTFDGPATITGDMNTYGTVVIGMQASNGYWITGLPYLLRRDLDPSSNDNTPVFVDQAA